MKRTSPTVNVASVKSTTLRVNPASMKLSPSNTALAAYSTNGHAACLQWPFEKESCVIVL
ncbi:hypothetical protein KV557_32260 [Kitasatospora aureofaciens]|uniref:hypothetical protein n=1 Tax=Kitasatospora aureofaciens TaxID=1894 RepID=UPI001C4566AD|nr:hypothetical protein [Kitasatospora aureofaciens]MBV6701722.1 hypothetical protein [Kitasatospora aureofaciens]